MHCLLCTVCYVPTSLPCTAPLRAATLPPTLSRSLCTTTTAPANSFDAPNSFDNLDITSTELSRPLDIFPDLSFFIIHCSHSHQRRHPPPTFVPSLPFRLELATGVPSRLTVAARTHRVARRHPASRSASSASYSASSSPPPPTYVRGVVGGGGFFRGRHVNARLVGGGRRDAEQAAEALRVVVCWFTLGTVFSQTLRRGKRPFPYL